MKQSKFTGSLREARGALLRELTGGEISSRSKKQLLPILGPDRARQVQVALEALCAEKLVQVKRGRYSLPGN